MFFDYLSSEPDAVALLLLGLLVGLTLLVGLAAGRARERRGAPDDAGREAGPPVSTWPHLLRLELLAALITLLALTWWAILLEIQPGPAADPQVTPAVARAPWFFVGVQELLQYFDAWLAGVVLPLLCVVGLCALPYLDVERAPSGRYTWRGRPVALALTVALLLLWLAPTAVGLFWRGENWAFTPAWRPDPPVSPTPLAEARPSLAGRLGLGGGAGEHVVGLLACLGPFALLAPLWSRLRRRPAVASMGRRRFFVAGALIVSLLGVPLKVALQLGLGVHHLWITPWFRI